MENRGFVLKAVDDSVVIVLKRSSACGGNCKSCAGCENTPFTFTIKNDIGAKPGDFVAVKVKEGQMIKFAAMIYLIPLVMFLIGIISGISIFKSFDIVNYELLGFLLGLLFLLLSVIILRVIDKRPENKKELTIEIEKIL